jgi:hypothetical protein
LHNNRNIRKDEDINNVAVTRKTRKTMTKPDSTTMKIKLYDMDSSVLSCFVCFIVGINQRISYTFFNSWTKVIIHSDIEYI